MIYIFFAGHGLASSDGEDMYLLPYDGSPRLLEDTAILREELFREVPQPILVQSLSSLTLAIQERQEALIC